MILKKNVINKNCSSPEQQDMKGIFFCDCSETPIPIQIQTLFHVRVIKIIIVLIFYINHEPNHHFHAHLCMMSTLFRLQQKKRVIHETLYIYMYNRFFFIDCQCGHADSK